MVLLKPALLAFASRLIRYANDQTAILMDRCFLCGQGGLEGSG